MRKRQNNNNNNDDSLMIDNIDVIDNNDHSICQWNQSDKFWTIQQTTLHNLC